MWGEETGLIESLEGKRAYPRVKPPFPATHGLFGCPTIVNNVETLACVPHIVARGADWFRSIGPEKSPGPKLFCVSGHVERPGVYELPMGTPLREIIYTHAGGIPNGRKLKGVIPGGASMPIFTPEEIDVPMDMDSVQKAGSFLGSAGIMVMDDSVCMVWTLLVLERFFHHESCGQCTPCREGTGWLEKVLLGLEHGNAAPSDVDLLLDIAGNMMGNTICALAAAAGRGGAESACPRLRSTAGRSRSRTGRRSSRRPNVWGSRSRTTAGIPASRSPATAACAWSRSRSSRSCRSPATR